MKIKVPATTANLGPGFDSFGLALNLYLELEILEPATKWQISHSIDGLPTDETNLVIKTALSVCSDLKPHDLIMTTNIPTTRGLGSSSSAIVAGIELANQLGQLNLSKAEKVKIASNMEGHPDNVAPAILGDFVVATQLESEVYYNEHQFPECEVIAIIPNYELKTSESRGVLPKTIDFHYGVEASSIGNMALSFLLTGKIAEATTLMEQDKWHEPFRNSLVEELQQTRNLKEKLGFYTALLSGAGPTILVLTSKDKVVKTLEEFVINFPNAEIEHLQIDKTGVQVFA